MGAARMCSLFSFHLIWYRMCDARQPLSTKAAAVQLHFLIHIVVVVFFERNFFSLLFFIFRCRRCRCDSLWLRLGPWFAIRLLLDVLLTMPGRMTNGRLVYCVKMWWQDDDMISSLACNILMVWIVYDGAASDVSWIKLSFFNLSD